MNETPVVRKALIIGSGPSACRAAKELSRAGIGITIVDRGGNNTSLSGNLAEDKAIEVLTGAEVVACQGAVGSFKIFLNQGREEIVREAGAVIIAEKPIREPRFLSYNLSPSATVISLSDARHWLNQIQEKNPGKIAFIVGIDQESNSLVMAEVLQNALDIRSRLNGEVCILTANVKVAGNGLEKLYQENRRAGVLFFKFTHTKPEIRQDGDGQAEISLVDEITSQQVIIKPDIVVVDEDTRPSDYLTALARIFNLDMDDSGFLQADNIYRFPVLSNRRGILVIGPSRTMGSPGEQNRDAGNAARVTIRLLREQNSLTTKKASIHRGKCTICLTCYRVCPHGAITWDNRAVIMQEACQACGICASECPMDAIQLEDYSDQRLTAQITAGTSKPDFKEKEFFIPRLIVFCCRRSAYPAMKLAERFGPLPLGLQAVEAPCAGKIDLDYIMKSFEGGADGVMVLTCHAGNCHAERGNIYAEGRVYRARGLLQEVGLEKDRLIFATIASNMGKQFLDIMNQAENKIQALGPSPLK